MLKFFHPADLGYRLLPDVVADMAQRDRDRSLQLNAMGTSPFDGYADTTFAVLAKNQSIYSRFCQRSQIPPLKQRISIRGALKSVLM